MVYHGTTKEKAENIICENCMIESVGDRHWLGNGVYFYRDFFYALRWIRCLDKTNDFLERYSIITAELNVKKERIFSFLNPDHKLLFQSVLEACIKRLDLLNLKGDVVDGAVLNIMFKRMKYGNDYDMVEAMFVHDDKGMSKYNSRLYYFPEIQICVKNKAIIEQLQKREVTLDELSQYLPVIDSYTTYISGVLKTKDMKYTTKRTNHKYRS